MKSHYDSFTKIFSYLDENIPHIDNAHLQKLVSQFNAAVSARTSKLKIDEFYQEVLKLSALIQHKRDNYYTTRMSKLFNIRPYAEKILLGLDMYILEGLLLLQNNPKTKNKSFAEDLREKICLLTHKINAGYCNVAIMFSASTIDALDGIEDAIKDLTKLSLSLATHLPPIDPTSPLSELAWSTQNNIAMLIDLYNAAVTTISHPKQDIEPSNLMKLLANTSLSEKRKTEIQDKITLLKNHVSLFFSDYSCLPEGLAKSALIALRIASETKTVIPSNFLKAQQQIIALINDTQTNTSEDITKLFTTILCLGTFYIQDQLEREEKSMLTYDEFQSTIEILKQLFELFQERKHPLNEITLTAVDCLLVDTNRLINRVTPAFNAKHLVALEQSNETQKKKNNAKPKPKPAKATKPAAKNEKPKTTTVAAASAAIALPLNKKTTLTFNNEWLTGDAVFMEIYNELTTFLKDTPEQPMLYVRGGMLRSLLLNKPIKDMDFIVKCELSNAYTFLGSRYSNCTLRQCQYPVIAIHCNGKTIEICSFNDELSQLSAHCDISVNSLFWNKNTGLIAFNNALEDIQNKVIRNPDPETNFKADTHRAFRSIRFFHQLEFNHIEKNTENAIRLIASEKPEDKSAYTPQRTFYELNNLFLFGKASSVFTTLDQLNLLCFLLPFCKEMDDFDKHDTTQALSNANAVLCAGNINSIPLLLTILIYYPIMRQSKQSIPADQLAGKVDHAKDSVLKCVFFPTPRATYEALLHKHIESAFTYREVAGLKL